MVENLTAVWFLLAGLLMFATALMERSVFRRGIYICGGIAMAFFAGEEISWGQRILGFATPEFLRDVNEQGEFNVHNIDLQTTMTVLHWGVLLLCTTSSAAFFCRKDSLFGIPLPSILLMFGFLVAMTYRPSLQTEGLFVVFDPGLSFDSGRNLLLLFFIYALLSRQVTWLIASAATVTLVLVLLYVNELNVNELSAIYRSVLSGQHEVQEYLFGVVCLCYALELWLAQSRSASLSWASFTSIKRQAARISVLRCINSRSRSAGAEPANVPDSGPARCPWSPWLAVCSLVMVGSIGLALFQFVEARALEQTYRSIVSDLYGEPAGRSTFDIYLIENRLIYFKEPCSLADRAQSFFLHVFPAEVDSLSDDRKQYGFTSLGFDAHPDTFLDGKCLITTPLPDYTLARIRTGQWIRGEGELWHADFSVGQ